MDPAATIRQLINGRQDVRRRDAVDLRAALQFYRDRGAYCCTALKRMTADAFAAWVIQQPEGHRYKVANGEVCAMAPGRAGHSRSKLRWARRLSEAFEARDLPCEVFVDGISVRVSDDTVYEPDVMVRCGPSLDDEVTEVVDRLIVLEVVSPSSHKRDSGVKLGHYFRIPSVRHYLIVNAKSKAVIHHCRDDAGGITTHIIRNGTIQLHPPGIELTDAFGQYDRGIPSTC